MVALRHIGLFLLGLKPIQRILLYLILKLSKTTAHGSIELRNVLAPNKFSYPKPSLLIKEIASLCTQKGDIVLDSFAGSGTTAHAVPIPQQRKMAGNRKFHPY